MLDGRSEQAKRFLGVFLAVALVNYIAHWFYFNHNYDVYKILDSVWVFTSLSVYPLYYYYLRLLTTDVRSNYRWGWILLPALILSLFSSILYLVMTPAETEQFIQEILYHNREVQSSYSLPVRLQILRIQLFKYIFAVEVLLTVFIGLRMINRFNEKVRNLLLQCAGQGAEKHPHTAAIPGVHLFYLTYLRPYREGFLFGSPLPACHPLHHPLTCSFWRQLRWVSSTIYHP